MGDRYWGYFVGSHWIVLDVRCQNDYFSMEAYRRWYFTIYSSMRNVEFSHSSVGFI